MSPTEVILQDTNSSRKEEIEMLKVEMGGFYWIKKKKKKKKGKKIFASRKVRIEFTQSYITR